VKQPVSVVCGHPCFEAVDFEREEADHLSTQLQLRFHGGCRLRVGLAILHHIPRRQFPDLMINTINTMAECGRGSPMVKSTCY